MARPFIVSLISMLVCGNGSLAESELPPLEEVKAMGALQSSYRGSRSHSPSNIARQASLAIFEEKIEPILRRTCFQCHGPDKQEADLRVDRLDPDLIAGGDTDIWLDVMDVISFAEMPPEDEDVHLADQDRDRVVDWLSEEIEVASRARHSEQGHSSFRRMTRYEYNYTLQDLLGLPYDFAKDLPPETHSEDGFENNSEMLQMSEAQLETYRESGRIALEKATVRGNPPEPLYYGIPMTAVAAKIQARRDLDAEEARERNENNPEELEEALGAIEERYALKEDSTHFVDLESGDGITSIFNYRKGKLSHLPDQHRPETPPVSQFVLIIPGGQEQKIDLSDRLPETGILRVRARASRTSTSDPSPPALRLKFGYQPTNDSRTSIPVAIKDVSILNSPNEPRFYEWDIPLTEIPRNVYRGVTQMGDLPNPTEYLIFQNIYAGERQGAETGIQIDYLEITAPYVDQWPPESHRRIFTDSDRRSNERAYAREILADFMPRAWRREIADTELDQKLQLFAEFRPQCDDFQEAIVEVLATVLASPKFLYIGIGDPNLGASDTLDDYGLATRLSMFLWCSGPDEELLDLAAKGRLGNRRVLVRQTRRLLEDPRSQRFAERFVRQWLGMQLLDYLDVDEEVYPEFDDELKESMQREPIALFHDALQNNRSVVDFLHADYSVVNERLARHYGLSGVYGNHFREAPLSSTDRRGGLMTQAGLLAMNSDGTDSHPLKRGIWMLERLLNDPPPEPPAAVPEIDLTDPEIAKMTLKERIEDHRNDPACISCHAKIDPWGIAFENFDAVGGWRDHIGGAPVDATSTLFNNQKLDGMDGLKRFLLANRQDQFCRAMVHKLTTYALGRPLVFSDRASIDEITSELRNKGDRLGDLIMLIVTSDLFKAR